MPLVNIHMRKGFSTDYKKKYLDAVHEGLLSALKIDDSDRFQRITEYEDNLFEVSLGKDQRFSIIEITMFPGRTNDMKKELISKITSNLVTSIGIRAEDVFIIINDPPLCNWGMRGEQLG